MSSCSAGPHHPRSAAISPIPGQTLHAAAWLAFLCATIREEPAGSKRRQHHNDRPCPPAPERCLLGASIAGQQQSWGHAIQSHLFRPLNVSKASHVEQVVSSSSINSDLQSVQNAGSVFTGQTAHNMQRSALIHARDRGASTEQPMVMAMINTAEVSKRRYLDPGRHITASQRVPRQRQGNGAFPAGWTSACCSGRPCTEVVLQRGTGDPLTSTAAFASTCVFLAHPYPLDLQVHRTQPCWHATCDLPPQLRYCHNQSIPCLHCHSNGLPTIQRK